MARSSFDQIDINNDGSISRNEFNYLMMADQSATHLLADQSPSQSFLTEQAQCAAPARNVIMDFVRDNYGPFAGTVCAMLTLAMTGWGWMVCNYLKLQDSLEVAAHKTFETAAVDTLIAKLCIVTLLIPAACVFLGVFVGVRIENLFMQIDVLWKQEKVKVFAAFVGIYSSVFGLLAGVQLSALVCSKLAPGVFVQAVSENLPWWAAPMLNGVIPYLPYWTVFIPLFILFGLLMILVSSMVTGPAPPSNSPRLSSFDQMDINNDGFLTRNEFNYEQMRQSRSPSQSFLTGQVQSGARARASTPPPRSSFTEFNKDSNFESRISRVNTGTYVSSDM